jgi:hypothetical protein
MLIDGRKKIYQNGGLLSTLADKALKNGKIIGM